MISKFVVTFMFTALLVLSTDIAKAKLLDPVDSSETANITIGTTTYDIDFLPPTILQGAADRIRDIVYYLRTFDTPMPIMAPDSVVVEEIVDTSNVYADIANTAFTDGIAGTPSLIDVVSATGKSCYVFEESLKIGDQSPEVLELQRFLNAALDASIAVSGPGSPGKETDYFGSLTFAAVFAYQDLYADEILVPLGLLNPTGYWGASTIAHANALTGCTNQ